LFYLLILNQLIHFLILY